MQQLAADIQNEYNTNIIYPPQELVFNALNQCPFSKVKVIILGQGTLS